MAPIEPIYTVQEVSELLRTSRRTVLELIRRGRLPATRIGREYRIAESAVSALLKCQLIPPRKPGKNRGQ